jgi:zinc transporter
MKQSNPVYGADQHGLLWAYLFTSEAPATEVSAAEAVNWLADRDADPAGFLWLHFSLTNSASERWMQAHLTLPETFYEWLHADAVSTRLEQADSALVGLMHDVRFDSTVDDSEISSVSVCLDPHVLVSARLRPLRSIDRLRAGIKAGQVFGSSADLLSQLLRDQAGVLADIVRECTVRVNTIEDRLLASRLVLRRRELGTLRRSLVRLQRLLAPEPAALFRLLSRPPAWLGVVGVQEMRGAAEEFSAAVNDAMALAERVRLLQEEFAALTNEQTHRTLFALTVVTVLALPINMVAGLFGMNVGGIPLAQYRHGFAVVVVALIAVTGWLGYLASKRRD